jgi:hypothetical protein
MGDSLRNSAALKPNSIFRCQAAWGKPARRLWQAIHNQILTAWSVELFALIMLSIYLQGIVSGGPWVIVSPSQQLWADGYNPRLLQFGHQRHAGNSSNVRTTRPVVAALLEEKSDGNQYQSS